MTINIKNKVSLNNDLPFVPLAPGEYSTPIQLDPEKMYVDNPLEHFQNTDGSYRIAQNLTDISTINNVNGVPMGESANNGWHYDGQDRLRRFYNHPQYCFIVDLGDYYHLDYCYLEILQGGWDKDHSGDISARGDRGDWEIIGSYEFEHETGLSKINFSGPARGGVRYIKVGLRTFTGWMRGFVLYGRLAHVAILQGKKLIANVVKRPINTMIGTNGFVFEPPFLVKDVSENTRFYFDFDWVTADSNRWRNDNINFVKLEDIALKFQSSHMGNMDMLLQEYKNTGQRTIFCTNNYPAYLVKAWESRGNNLRPVNPGLDKDNLAITTNPMNYTHMARIAYMLAARYGSNKDADISGFAIAPGDVVRVGMDVLTALEFGNEADAFWIQDEYMAPEEMAAFMSAIYDGHKGALGERMGMKAADPGMLLSNGALATPENLSYVFQMKLWWDTHRGIGDYPIDIINYHYYNSDGDTQRSGYNKGLPPEMGYLTELIYMWDEFRSEHFPNAEVWNTEIGYDEHLGGGHSPKDRGAYERAIHKSWWLVRTMLVTMFGRLDATGQYWFSNVGSPRVEDMDPNEYNPGLFLTSQYVEGDVVGSAFYGRQPITAYHYMNAFKREMANYYLLHPVLYEEGLKGTNEEIIKNASSLDVWGLSFINYKEDKTCIVVWVGEEEFEETTVDIYVGEDELEVVVGDFEDAEIKLLTKASETIYTSTVEEGKRKITVPVNGCPKVIYTKNIGTLKPFEPLNVQTQKLTDGSINIVWTDRNTEYHHIWIQRRLSGSTSYDVIFSGILNKPGYIDNTVVPGLSYQYKVSHIDPEEEPPIPSPTDDWILPTDLEPISEPIFLGSGSGSLTIDGTDPMFTGKDCISINAGNYSSINISNFSRTGSEPMIIKNNGEVLIGDLNISNCKGVYISGRAEIEDDYGFKIIDHYYRPVSISGVFHDLTLRGILIDSPQDYPITNSSTINYLGTKETRHENFKIIGCKFIKCSEVLLAGDLTESVDINLFVGFEFAYNEIIGREWNGNIVGGSNMAQYNIHHNKINNFNTENRNHNGLFFMQGSGKFHSNIATNYQGNMIRAWMYSRIDFPAPVEVYNNIGYNCWQYSLFELQGIPDRIISGKTIKTGGEVYNNTGGVVDCQDYWAGVLIDTYSSSDQIQVYNNLGFQMTRKDEVPMDVAGLLNKRGDSVVVMTNNRYFANQEDAVENTINFKSKVPGVGAGEI